MTVANKITIARILLVPFFATQLLEYGRGGAEWHRILAISCFAVAALSDALDGYIARRFNQRSELGSILDPLADKLLLVSGLVLLTFDNRPRLQELPSWVLSTVLSRDILMLIGFAVISYTCGKITVRPHMLGKISTVLQMATILWILLKWNPDWLFLLATATALCTGGSGILYVLDGIRQLSNSPFSAPKSPPRL